MQRGETTEQRSSKVLRVLVVDDDPDIRSMIQRVLTREDFEVTAVASGEEALKLVMLESFAVMLLDLMLPGCCGLETLRELQDVEFPPEVVVLTGQPEFESAVEAMKLGAYEYLGKPLKSFNLIQVTKNAAEKYQMEPENNKPRQIVSQHQSTGRIVCESPEMAAVINMAERCARSNLPVLILGETGTGKGLIAKTIHAKSQRADRSFVHVNCGALQEQLFESELFGHEKGAFTGAANAKPGLFEVADGGTLFLDEVAELSLSMQAKLLQALDVGELRRVGGTSLRKVDVRVLAATNKVLRAEVRSGAFRQDLFYRLNVARIELPPLRDRKGDIRELVNLYLKRFRFVGGAKKEISPGALHALCAYRWPGNVRELANAVESLAFLTDQRTIRTEDLPSTIRPARICQSRSVDTPLPMPEVERLHLIDTLAYTGGNKAAAARLLGMHVKTLSYKVKAFNIAL